MSDEGDLGKKYAEAMRAPMRLSPEDEEKIAAMLNADDDEGGSDG